MEAFMDAAGFSVYTLAEQTILADMVTDARMLTVCSARVSSAKGMAQMGSFLLGGTIAAMNPRLPFALAAAACISAASVLVFGVPETGPSKRSRDAAADCAIDTNGANGEELAASVSAAVPVPACGPRALLRGGRTLRLLTISAVLDGMVDKTFQIRAIHATQRVGMSAPLFGVFSAGRGFTSMCGGYATKLLLKITGSVQGFSAVTHACCVFQHALMALAARGGTTGVLLMFFALLPMTYGDMGVRQSATMALHTRAAAAAGYGLGEAQAALKTIQSAVQLCMPVCYGRLYALYPSSPWTIAGLLSACSQLVFSMLSREEVEAIDQPQPPTK
jgi:hypothetical protein